MSSSILIGKFDSLIMLEAIRRGRVCPMSKAVAARYYNLKEEGNRLCLVSKNSKLNRP